MHAYKKHLDRLENEHIGNMDQYRVTREMPLPYIFEATGEDRGDIDVFIEKCWRSDSSRVSL